MASRQRLLAAMANARILGMIVVDEAATVLPVRKTPSGRPWHDV
jgi:hypothetical protein